MSAADAVPYVFDFDEMAGWLIERSGHADLTNEIISTAAVRLGRNSYPDLVAVLMAEGLLTRDVAAHVLAEAWLDAEYPESHLEPEMWCDWFRWVGYSIDGQRAARRRPRKPLTLYRGCTPRYDYGMSWTADLAQARWFAERYNGQRGDVGRVIVADVDASRLLARITGGPDAFGRDGESEYIVSTTLPDTITYATLNPAQPAPTQRHDNPEESR